MTSSTLEVAVYIAGLGHRIDDVNGLPRADDPFKSTGRGRVDRRALLKFRKRRRGATQRDRVECAGLVR